MGLTMLRLLLLPVFLWTLLFSSHDPHHTLRWVAVLIFAVMALTDKLDGYLARRLQQTSKLGAILDPLADKILVGCSVILLSFAWVAPEGFRIPEWVVVAVYGKDAITVVGALVLLALAGKVTVRARGFGKASTVLQLALVLAVLLAPDIDSLAGLRWSYFVRGLFWAVSVVAVVSTADYILEGVRQLKAARRERQPASNA